MATITRTYRAEVEQTFTIDEADLSEEDLEVVRAYMSGEHFNGEPVRESDIDEIIEDAGLVDDGEEVTALDDWQLTISINGSL